MRARTAASSTASRPGEDSPRCRCVGISPLTPCRPLNPYLGHLLLLLRLDLLLLLRLLRQLQLLHVLQHLLQLTQLLLQLLHCGGLCPLLPAARGGEQDAHTEDRYGRAHHVS